MKTLDKIDVTKLRDDGDTLQLWGGQTLRLLITTDDGGFTINDFDCYGRTEWVNKDGLGRHTRPECMNGDARVIDTGRGAACWWQPPADVAAEYIPSILKEVLGIHQFGFQIYTLELLRGADVYGRDIVVEAVTIGGIEPFIDSSYSDSVIRDLLNDIEIPV